MIIININGGLGNQMFQYALGRVLSIKHNTQFKIYFFSKKGDTLRKLSLNIFNFAFNIATEEEVKSLKYKSIPMIKKFLFLMLKRQLPTSSTYYLEKQFQFDDTVFNSGDNLFIEGFWQSEKYFLNYQDIIRRDFTLKNPISEKTKFYLDIINESISVSLHIRRGDFVNNPITNKFHGTCDLEYYYKGISILKDMFPNLKLFVFSDDKEWAKVNLKYEDINFIDECRDYEEMFLMSCCKHNIIANSSFSWWGAWLNNNPDKIVIAPEKWFNVYNADTSDLYPNNWIKLG